MLRCLSWPLAFCLAAAAALAQGLLPVPALTGRVFDQTATLAAEQRAALAARLAAFEQETGAQIVVLIVPTTAPEDIDVFSQRVGDTWKVGRQGVGDGLLLVVAKNDRTVRIEVAKALEGAVPDLAARQIIDGVIVPAFRKGDFAGGLNGALDRIFSRIRGETPPPDARHEGIPWGVAVVIFTMLAFFTAIGIDYSRLRGHEPAWLGKLSMAALGTGAAWLMFSSFLLGLVGAVALPVMAYPLARLVALLGRNQGSGVGDRTEPAGSRWSGGDIGSSSSTNWSSSDSSSSNISSGGGGDFGGGGSSGKW